MNHGISSVERFEQILDQIPKRDLEFLEIPFGTSTPWDKFKIERPCIDRLRKACKIPAGTRNERIYRVAVELRRRGWNQVEAMKECIRVNEKSFVAALKRSEATSTVRSAFKSAGAHRCSDPILMQYCVGTPHCHWWQVVVNGQASSEIQSEAFERNWRPILRLAHRLLYEHIAKRETKKRIPPGGVMYASARQLTQEMELPDKGVVLRGLKALEKCGLIEIKSRGENQRPSGASGFATQFRRIVPVPMPGHSGTSAEVNPNTLLEKETENE